MSVMPYDEGPDTVVGDDEGPPTVAPHLDEGVGGWDLWLLVAAVLLACFGLVMTVSASGHYASTHYGNAWHFGTRQVVGLMLGGLLGFGVLIVRWPLVRASAFWAWLATTVMVFLVHAPIIGKSVNGAPRWLDLGPLNVQPTELAKVGLALVFADAMARNEGHMRDVVGLLTGPIAVYLGLLVLGAHLQSDLGSIALFVGIAGVALFVAGLELKWVAGLVGIVVAGAALLIAIEPYRAARLASFLNPLADPQGDGYQVVQGWVAMAVGGTFGQGLGQGVAQQGFLPEAHTDMIAAIVAEELGVFGWGAIFFLHGIVLWRGTRIAYEANTLFDMVLASCLTAVLAAQVVINTGVIAGLVPPKGLVLPFMSYGASAVITHTVMVALLLRVSLETHRHTPRALTQPGGL